jgi:hypothetical protein
MEKRLTTEIVELHKFFEDWFTGKLSDDDATFSRVENALAPGFVLISPRGVIDERGPLLAMLRRAHGSKRDFKIWIENPRARPLADSLWLVIYEEWQTSGANTTARLSTALFSTAEEPVWQHVHETWLEQEA